MKQTKPLQEKECKACESLKRIGSDSPCGIHYGRYSLQDKANMAACMCCCHFDVHMDDGFHPHRICSHCSPQGKQEGKSFFEMNKKTQEEIIMKAAVDSNKAQRELIEPSESLQDWEEWVEFNFSGEAEKILKYPIIKNKINDLLANREKQVALDCIKIADEYMDREDFWNFEEEIKDKYTK